MGAENLCLFMFIVTYVPSVSYPGLRHVKGAGKKATLT